MIVFIVVSERVTATEMRCAKMAWFVVWTIVILQIHASMMVTIAVSFQKIPPLQQQQQQQQQPQQQ